MSATRLWLSIGLVAGGLGLGTACEIEEDFEEVEQCVPGQWRCRADGRVDACNDNGSWAPDGGGFFCPPDSATCMIMDNTPVCM